MSYLRADVLSAANGTSATTLTGQVAAKVWAQFHGGANGTGGAVNGSFNLSSITANGTGDFTLNFTNALLDAYYAAQVTGNFFNSTGVASCGVCFNQPSYYQTTSVRVGHQQSNSYTTATYMSVTVTR